MRLLLLISFLLLAACQSNPFDSSAEQASSADTDRRAEFKSSLNEDEIMSQSQVIKILKENGYVGGAGFMDVNGERTYCEFAGKRPSDGATICIQKDEEKGEVIVTRPRLGNIGLRRL
ncbi:hypothetical protein [Solemya velum gill symbiont]|uniref:Lipoprotein n=1 Tax=Solemya velum gill symbiont TaxID=2340 RepID=A0A0B0HC62_SOVGS|nr:hypothetical protein [Solemya velum gill symbiont]KHF25026.1 hypothetical protein JV46_04760 [Solemya velum gill symbiont]OOY34270.1 hypothetical protein BOV88_10900 [Solemya velum gill symbiont]OOY37043.1 hypothetical protein BOV89_09470 [Solemya velum gill symbiont]OOY40260.1 hypothetical protein BOV90_04980 [Solemya velum gill symbiont]OOY42091.1 hypothetical protein BOV91_08105 [Solemya velum gill symbiont]